MDEMRSTEQGLDPDRTLIGEAANPPAGHALPGGPDPVAPVVPVRTGEAVAPDHQLPAHAGPSHWVATDGTGDPDATRRQIGQTRARMSETIDQIEEQLLRRKERLQEQLDVRGQIRNRLTPVRELVERQPLAAVGGVMALGLVLGYLTGGADEPEAGPAMRGSALWAGGAEAGGRSGWQQRARRWEAHSRELMRRNEQLELENQRLREELDGGFDAGSAGWLGGVARAVGGLFGRGATESEMVVEIEEEEVPGEYHPSASYDQFSHAQRVRDPSDPLQG